MSVWLTRLLLDTRHRVVRADLRDAVNLHRRVMMLVPDGLGAQARAQTGVLFRLEESRSGISLLIQSQQRPNLDRLPDGYGRGAVKDIDPLLARLRLGLPVLYRIAANPSKRLAKADGNEKSQLTPTKFEVFVLKRASSGDGRTRDTADPCPGSVCWCS